MQDGVVELMQANFEQKGPGKVAIIDIGSNTVRLVVYDAPLRLPVPLFNEKAQCQLALGMDKTGRMNPDGVELALKSISRFIKLIKAMGVDHLDLIATSAVRDADDGPDFVREIKKRFDRDVQVLSGEEEARLAATGLLSGVPEADGLVGDLGGGSLDLVALNKGEFGEQDTLPLGHIRLSEFAVQGTDAMRQHIMDQFETLPWLKKTRSRTLYAIGGSWRAVARILLEQTNHPLHVVDNFTIRGSDALRLVRIIAGLQSDSGKRLAGIAPGRMATLPFAATVLEILLRVSKPDHLTFSGFGVREGQLLMSLPEDVRKQDPLISACEAMRIRTGRFAIKGKEIMSWMDPLFEVESDEERRLRHAACLLSDIGWSEHPDYRAEHAFHRVLRVPFAGLDHRQRVLIADAVYVRYNGEPDSVLVEPVRSLLDSGQMSWVRVVGLALRLAHTVAGSAPGILSKTRLRIKNDRLYLQLPKDVDRDVFMGDAVGRRLKTLGNSLNLKGKFYLE